MVSTWQVLKLWSTPFSLQKCSKSEISRILLLWFMTHLTQLFIRFLQLLFDVVCKSEWLMRQPALLHPNLLCILYTLQITSGALIYCCHLPQGPVCSVWTRSGLLLNGVNNFMWTWERNYHWLHQSLTTHIIWKPAFKYLDCLFVSCLVFKHVK